MTRLVPGTITHKPSYHRMQRMPSILANPPRSIEISNRGSPWRTCVPPFSIFFFPLSPATWIERRFEGISCNRTRLTPSPPLDRFEFPTRVSASHNPWKNVELNGTPRYRPCIIRLIMKKVRVIASFADLVERKKRKGRRRKKPSNYWWIISVHASISILTSLFLSF